MPVKVEVWGDYALFSRPELKVERMRYDVMTPSAARGLLEAIYWHPGLRWRVSAIHVLNPIRFASVRRNEVSSVITKDAGERLMKGGSARNYLVTSECIAQRASLLLCDVHYVIEARFDMTEKASPEDSEGKFLDIMRRRIERGQCYHMPCFGCPASFRAWDGGEIPTAYPDEDKDLGLMQYDMDYSDPQNITPMFFRAKLINGVLRVPAEDSGEVFR